MASKNKTTTSQSQKSQSITQAVINSELLAQILEGLKDAGYTQKTTDELMKIHVSNLPSGLPDAALPESVRSFLSDRLRLSASLFEVIPHEALPKAPSGKTLYSELG